MEELILIEKVHVLHGRLIVDVRIPCAEYRVTSPQLIKKILEEYPTLDQHACVNRCGETFGAVMNETSTPHLLEHVIIAEQIKSAQDDRMVYVGTTQWTEKSNGCARIQVNFADDLEALRALRRSYYNLCKTLRGVAHEYSAYEI